MIGTTSVVLLQQHQYNQNGIQRFIKSIPSNFAVTYRHIFLGIYPYRMSANI